MQRWGSILALCFIGLLMLVACRLSGSQTSPEPTLAIEIETEPATGTDPTPAVDPTSTPSAQISTDLTLTQADNGETIQLQIGQRFALQLGEASQWEITIADPTIVSRVAGISLEQGGQGIYEAKNRGQTTLTAVASQDGALFEVAIEVAANAVADDSPAPIPGQAANQPLFFNRVHMVTPLEGWAVDSGQAVAAASGQGEDQQGRSIFRTADGGHSWREVTPPSLDQGLLIAAHFSSFQHAWLANLVVTGAETEGDPAPIVVYSTADGGQTWQASPPVENKAGETGSSGVQGSLTFVDERNGWLLIRLDHAGSESLNLYRTQDGGQLWTMVAASGDQPGSLPRGCTTNGMTFLDPQAGWIAGTCAGRQLYFYATQDGGQTWAPDNLQPPSSYPADLFSRCRCTVLPPLFPGGPSGVLPVSILDNSPATFLYLTQDGGESWLPYSVPMSTLPIPPAFADAQTGWISDGKALYITQNGGQSWTWISKLPTQVVLGGFNFVTPETGFITDGQLLYASDDGGKTWKSWQPASE